MAKGIFIIIAVYGNEHRSVGDRYADVATILRRTYFTALFMQDHPEVIKWIEYRSARRSDIFREEILEIKLGWRPMSTTLKKEQHPQNMQDFMQKAGRLVKGWGSQKPRRLGIA
ncbi:hypothetical protein [Ectobacillus funiculus]|uniref:Uncharacterized protein n=1 Tax=Ectobacillus funiculus TaxID=137993 RepID=A0ABV5WIP3_9BACI